MTCSVRPFITMDHIAETLRSPTAVGLAALVVWVSLCRGMRFLRRDTKHAEYLYKTREDYKKMTAEDAFEIVKYVQSLEFPFITGKALAFALFRSVGASNYSSAISDSSAQDIWHSLHLEAALRNATARKSGVFRTTVC
jgi:hypothetical protein